MINVTEQSFLKDVSKHEMKIILDDGLNRNIRFSNPDSYCYSFNLITYKGGLLITGDCGAYVFERTDDMFRFFVNFPEKKTDHLYINERYWSEKVVAMDKCDGIEHFSDEKFKNEVEQYFFDWCRDSKEYTSKEERREIYTQIQDEILDIDDSDEGAMKIRAACGFESNVASNTFEFHDFWEHDFSEYSNRYVWNLYAIVWGIRKYYEMKGQ